MTEVQDSSTPTITVAELAEHFDKLADALDAANARIATLEESLARLGAATRIALEANLTTRSRAAGLMGVVTTTIATGAGAEIVKQDGAGKRPMPRIGDVIRAHLAATRERIAKNSGEPRV